MDEKRQLLAATQAVKEVINHYDVGANIVLISPSDFTSFLRVDPSWSCAKLIQNGIRIEAERKKFASKDERLQALQRTFFLLMQISHQADESRHFGTSLRKHLKTMLFTS